MPKSHIGEHSNFAKTGTWPFILSTTVGHWTEFGDFLWQLEEFCVVDLTFLFLFQASGTTRENGEPKCGTRSRETGVDNHDPSSSSAAALLLRTQTKSLA